MIPSLTVVLVVMAIWWIWRRRTAVVPITQFDPGTGRWQRVCGRCGTGLKRSRPRLGIAFLHRGHSFTRFYRCASCGLGYWLEVVDSRRESVGDDIGEPALQALDAPGFGHAGSDQVMPPSAETLRPIRRVTRRGHLRSRRMRSRPS